MTLQTSGQISISQINTEITSSTSNSLATLAAASHEYRAQFDNLQNAPHAMSEWYGYDHTITWEHTLTVEGATRTISKNTYNMYGFDSSAFDFADQETDFGACSESNPRWASAIGGQNVFVGWFLWDSQLPSLKFYLYRSTGSSPITNTGFTSVQISTGAYGVGPLNRTAATYNNYTTSAPNHESWIWTGSGLNTSPFGTTDDVTSTVRWR